MDCADAACWIAAVDAAPWHAEAARWMSNALAAARHSDDRTLERRLQRILASEFGPESAWAATNETDVVEEAASLIALERPRWLPDAPLTTLDDLGFEPYDEPLPVTSERVARGDDDLRAWLTIGERLERQDDPGYRTRWAMSHARHRSDDPVIQAYALLHGEWMFCEMASDLSPLLGRLDAAPPAVRRDIEDVFAAYTVSQGAPQALAALDDEAALRFGASSLIVQRSWAVPVALDLLLERDPLDVRAPMWRWLRWRADKSEASRRTFVRLSGPGSVWWSGADADARDHLGRLLVRATGGP